MAALAYPLGHKIKKDDALTASQVLAKAQALGVKLALSGGELHAVGCRAGIAQLAQDIMACKPQLVQLLSKPATAPDWTPPAPLPDSGMARLLALAIALCDRTGASEKTRQDWRADIEQAASEHRGHLLALLQGLMPKAMPPAVVAAPSPPAPAPTWRDADHADQSHYWACKQCRTGAKCPKGQRLSDAYIEAASRERFIAAKTDPAKPLPKFHVAQPWNEVDKTYQAHHWSCDACKAYARSNGHSQRCTEGQQLHSAYEQAAAKGATP